MMIVRHVSQTFLSFRAKSRNLLLLTLIPQQRETPLDMTEKDT